MNIDIYIKELVAINGGHLEIKDNYFRAADGYCIDKSGREISFSAPEEIDASLRRVITVFSDEFESANDLASLSRTFARFYYGFIAVHPFTDGNYRTACTFLQRRAQEKSYEIASLRILKKILLEGAVAAEMQKLMTAFEIILKPQ